MTATHEAHASGATAQRAVPIAERVETLLARMTLAEKVGQMTQLTLAAVASRAGSATERFALDDAKLEEAIVKRHVGALLNVFNVAMGPDEWHTIITTIQRVAGTSRLAVPVIFGIDAVHGQNYQTTSTIFPHNIAMAATWNPAIVRLANEITAYETRASGIPWNFAPVLDIGRQPLWPRFYETFGEDPHLASVLGREAVLGNQRDPWPALAPLLGSDDGRPSVGGDLFVAACGKHFLGYSMPLSGKDRTTAWIPDRELREIFLPSFRAAIGAGVRSMMVNSSDINGMPVHASAALLTDLLRTELGFTGIVDSDWEDVIRLHSTHRVAKDRKDAVRMAVLAGVDMSMVPFDCSFSDDLIALINEGAIPEARIDASVRRILRVKAELGLFERPLPDDGMMPYIGAPAFHDVSRAAAEQSVTLLENDGLLPLAKTARVLVTGPAATSLPAMFGGWSYIWQGNDLGMYPPQVKTLLDAVRDAVGAAAVSHVAGSTFAEPIDVAAAVSAARAADVAIVAIGEDAYAETPGNIDDLCIPAAQIELARAIEASGTPVVLVLLHGRPRVVRGAVDGARAVLTAYQAGPYAGEALARVIFGDVNPGGKLPFTWPRATGAIMIPYDRAYPAEIGGTDVVNVTFEPEWHFGHGLSYTSFAYEDLRVANATVRASDVIHISVMVRNTGDRAGAEVVQLYVRDLVASVNPPIRRLRAFERVTLEPEASRAVTFALPATELSFVGHDNALVLEPGTFEVQVGGLSARFELVAQ